GGTGLLLLAFRLGILNTIKGLNVGTIMLAAAGLAAYQPFFFSGIAKTGVAVGTVVTIGSSPILSGILGFLINRERPRGRWFIATTLSVMGCVILIIGGNSVSVNTYGVAMSLGAGFGYALYSVVTKRLMENRDPLAVVATVNFTAALMLSPTLVTGNLSWLAGPRGLTVALYMGLFTCMLAYALFSRGLARLPVSTAVTLSLAEPLTAALLGIFVLGEKLALPVFIGAGLLLAGLGVLSLNLEGVVRLLRKGFGHHERVNR
ncbi:MAG: EamA family transporter, partial [Eubacteriales bacterium]